MSSWRTPTSSTTPSPAWTSKPRKNVSKCNVVAPLLRWPFQPAAWDWRRSSSSPSSCCSSWRWSCWCPSSSPSSASKPWKPWSWASWPSPSCWASSSTSCAPSPACPCPWCRWRRPNRQHRFTAPPPPRRLRQVRTNRAGNPTRAVRIPGCGLPARTATPRIWPTRPIIRARPPHPRLVRKFEWRRHRFIYFVTFGLFILFCK